MRWLPFLVAGAAGVLPACASSQPAASPTSLQPPASSADPAARPLTADECASLGQWIVSACRDRANSDHSVQADGWCSDMVRGTAEDGSWVAKDCVPHIKYVDAVCFQSTTRVRNLMDCDSNVDRSH